MNITDLSPNLLTILFDRQFLEKKAKEFSVDTLTSIGTPTPSLVLAEKIILTSKNKENVVADPEFSEKIAEANVNAGQGNFACRPVNSSILNHYNYRSGWYALRVYAGKEKSIIDKLLYLVQKKGEFTSFKNNPNREIGKEHTVDLKQLVVDIAYPMSKTEKFELHEPTRGYIFVKLHFYDDDDSFERSRKVTLLKEAFQTIEGINRFTGTNVAVGRGIESIVSFANGRLKINGFQIFETLPSVASDDDIARLASNSDSFSLIHKNDDTLKPGFVCYLQFTSKNNRTTYTKVVISKVDRDNFTTVYVRKCGKKYRNDKPFPALRKDILSIAEYRNRENKLMN